MDYFLRFSKNKSPWEKGFYYTPNKKQTSISELHHALSASTTFDLNNLRSNIRSFAAGWCFKKPQNNISRVLLTFSVLLYKFLMTIRRWNFESETFLWRWYIFHSWKTNIGMILMQDFIWFAQITDIRMTKKKGSKHLRCLWTTEMNVTHFVEMFFFFFFENWVFALVNFVRKF